MDAVNRTWRDLEARGAEIDTTTALVVSVRAPADVAIELRAALAWRIEAMRGQIREATRLGGHPPTLVAVPGLVLPQSPACRWRGFVEMKGRPVWQDKVAQRARPGLCSSCGEDFPGTGHCTLCNAARVAALRAEGVIVSRPVFVPPPPVDFAVWRASLYAEIARPDPNALVEEEAAFW